MFRQRPRSRNRQNGLCQYDEDVHYAFSPFMPAGG